MDRFIVACLVIIGFLCAISIMNSAVMPLFTGMDDYAVRIALADPDVKNAVANNQGNCEIISVMPQDKRDMSGFINASGTIIAVNMSMQGRMFGPDRYIAFVDIDQSKVVSSEWYSYRGFPGSMDITLPPGMSYYHLLTGPIMGGPGMSDDFGVHTFLCSPHRLTPENATVYPALVDEANLSKMKNGSRYESAVYNDTFTKQPAKMDGSLPAGHGWSVNASVKRPPQYGTGNWPDFDYSQRYYIVFKNNGPDTVSMIIGM